jgi:anion-transporting  ArsA/GET3 family ATPase
VLGLTGHRLIFVTGKGGAGKSTVAAALAIASAKGGRRTLLADVSGRGDRLPPETGLAPELYAISIDPALAMQEYLRIRMGSLGASLASTSVFRALSATTPGMREMQTMAKLWELAHPERPAGGGRPYDVVVVDAPAAGHTIGMLRTPTTFAALARVGPVAVGARMIAAMVADPACTAFVAVTTAEATAVAETLWLGDALAADGLGLAAVVLNRLGPQRFTADEIAALEGCRAASAVRGAVLAHRRASVERAHLARLVEHASAPVVTLPFLFADALGEAELRALAGVLADARLRPAPSVACAA